MSDLDHDVGGRLYVIGLIKNLAQQVAHVHVIQYIVDARVLASQDPGVDNVLDDVDVRDLLREVFDESDNIKPSTDIMVKVRQTLREESGGRYFNDAWSSSSNPIRQFLLTSLVMLLVAILIAILLVPYGMSTLP